MDAWSPLQIEKMRLGGNTRLRNFFREQQFPTKLSVQEKFDNDAMEKYRKRLAAMAQGKSVDKIEKIGYIPRPLSPTKKFSSQVSVLGGSSRGRTTRLRRPMSSMSGGLDFRKPTKTDWGLDSLMSSIQKKSSQVASRVAKGTADVTSKLQKGMGEVGQQIKDKDLGSQISSGWNVALGWASKTVKNISEIVNEYDGVNLYNKNAISATSQGKKMESKSSKEYFLGGQRGISSNSYFDGAGDPSSHKAKVTKTFLEADDNECSSLPDKEKVFIQQQKSKLTAQRPVEQKVAVERKILKNSSSGEFNSPDDINGGANGSTHRDLHNVHLGSSDDETWEW